jgi:putative addiction module component (TIGR02574 family)
MDFSQVLSAANSLSIDDRIRLVEAIWQSIESEKPMPELSAAQKQELDRRLAEDDASPDDAVPWEVVDAEIRSRVRP